jgi:hypothetical protein
MLQKLGDHIQSCLQHADRCRAAAESERDIRVRSQLEALGQQWQHVAKTYEFVASLEKFLLDQHRQALPNEVEKLPTEPPQEIS